MSEIDMMRVHEKSVYEVKIMRDNFARTLESLGYNVKFDVSLQGESGVKHKFDIVASDDNRRVAIDFVRSSKDVNLVALATCAKALDIKGFVTILVAPSDVESKLVFSPRQVVPLFYEDMSDALHKLEELVV
ncbi:MAG: hypothetical protein NDF54_11605 [archaeon GB-1867-035]|nr:hypothetical protein [Candidatus Culexmicrobium profundum]